MRATAPVMTARVLRKHNALRVMLQKEGASLIMVPANARKAISLIFLASASPAIIVV